MRLTLLSLAVLSLVGCSPKESMKGNSMATPPSLAEPAVLVELAEVKQGLIEELLERSSPLEAEAQVQVLARTQNPAVELFVEEGDKVTRGQVLLRLESDRQQIDCDQAMNQVEKAQIDFDASEKLYRENLISEQAYLRHQAHIQPGTLAGGAGQT